jgi:hypothetical protein
MQLNYSFNMLPLCDWPYHSHAEVDGQ